MTFPFVYDPLDEKWKHPAPYASCFFLEKAYIDLRCRTLVIRSLPFLARSTVHLPDSISKQEDHPKKIIGIVPPDCIVMSENDEYYAGIDERRCNSGICNHSISSEASSSAPNAMMWGGAPFHAARFITLVFWTKSPEKEWKPPRKHFHPLSDSETTEDSDNSVWESYKKLDDSAGNVYGCRFSDWMMRDLALGLSRHVTEGDEPMGITIVNAVAFMPPHYLRSQKYAERLRSGEATHATAEEHFMQAVKWEQIREKRPLEIKFLTMQEWIKTGEWEDALSEREMRPWLDSMANEA
ncbi:hypothetical protein A1Q1_05777 [Trichosporon asahii var. asahii CBS 2479]|uniref:Uncharacterized protein n=1 Tax=Trichosporon asahii var. asahii (strain ATCC 90039 / CBS 2479 / JCM 2466 / KCTC 7840 / NBRC 103889/ NCYC 2677 / UAMH 7654) TaxID=1186058 RepID=J5Q5V0_TRIAS|nr:hypothetical protein A1Q1_05777 [Trichosporon asahii var. asahii CBS 2479]EJT45628.1 hypothetical protein A1Q1_05777 [Trichosporon asahii var. asahii CBS 2479]